MRFTPCALAVSTLALLATASVALADDAATPPAATPAAAATAQQPAPAAPQPAAPATQPAAAATPPQVPAAVQAWAKFCDTEANGHRVCIVRKLVFQNTSIVGSVVLRVDATKGVPTLAVAAVPVGVVLTPGLKWQIDNNKAYALPYWHCTPQTCESEQLVKADFIAALRKGKILKLTAKNVAGKDFVISVPLAGFGTAYDLQNAPTLAEYSKSLPH